MKPFIFSDFSSSIVQVISVGYFERIFKKISKNKNFGKNILYVVF